MPLIKYECKICNKTKETLKHAPHCFTCGKDMEALISSPNTKFEETVNEATGKKKIKGLQKILKERARNYARDNESDELIQKNISNKLTSTNLLNKDGIRRKKVDDI